MIMESPVGFSRTVEAVEFAGVVGASGRLANPSLGCQRLAIAAEALGASSAGAGMGCKGAGGSG
jgi:hypothetical protein